MEGMRVQVNDPVAVGPTSDFGEIPVVVPVNSEFADQLSDHESQVARFGLGDDDDDDDED
jgi:hypothetical protein